MRVVISGGTGLLGRALAHDLASDGHEVVALSRDPARHEGALPSGVTLARWDGRSATGWGDHADGADAIVNLAGEGIGDGRWTAARKRRILDSRVDAVRAVSEAVEGASRRPAAVVQASAVGYYGPRGDDPLDESAPPGDDFLAEVCQVAERKAGNLAGLGVRVPVARTGVVLTPDGGALKRMLTPFKLGAGGPIGGGGQYMSWIHVADEVAALRHLIEDESANGPYNLTAPNPVSNAEFGRSLGRALGRPALLPTPGFAMRLAFGDMATVILDGQRALPGRLQAAGFEYRYPDLDGALSDLLG